MAYQYILYEKSEGIAWITFNRPEKMNALNPVMLGEWKDALEDAGKDDAVGVVVVTGAGRAYCAGLDLQAVGAASLEGGAVGAVFDIPGRAVIDTIQALPKIVIAMINGVCVTGGLETLLSFDLVVAAEDAKFQDSHVRWGLRPSWGMSQRLPRTVGIMRARELSYTAKFFSGKEAYELGLVNRVAPAEKLRETTIALANEILINSREAVAAVKYLYNKGWRKTLEEGIKMEEETHFVISDTNKRLDKFLKKG